MEVGLPASRADAPRATGVGGGDEPDRLGQVDACAGVAGGVVGAVRGDGETHQVDDRSVLEEFAVSVAEESLMGGQE